MAKVEPVFVTSNKSCAPKKISLLAYHLGKNKVN